MEKTASTKNTTYTLVAIALMTAVICAVAPLSIPVGAIPISLATLAVYAAGICLGPRDGVIAVALYILLAGAGVPVF